METTATSEDPLGGRMLNLSAGEQKLVDGFVDLVTELRFNKISQQEQELSDTPSATSTPKEYSVKHVSLCVEY